MLLLWQIYCNGNFKIKLNITLAESVIFLIADSFLFLNRKEDKTKQ